MADLIDRDALAVSLFPLYNKDDVDIYKIIKDAPSVNRWIPCSERLPESCEEVLVWFEYFRYGDYNCMYQTYGIGNYSEHYDSWLINHETGWKNLNVIAWMPLPEPPVIKEESK